MREKVQAALENVIDKHQPKLQKHIDHCLEWLKETIVEHLPHHIMEHIKKHTDEGDDFFEAIGQIAKTMSEHVSGDFKDEIRAVTRDRLDEITVNSSDDLTTVVVREAKKAVGEVTRKKEKKDEEEWWKEIDLSFLLKGKEGIVNQFIEFVKPPIREFGGDVKQKVSIRLPEHIKRKMSEKIGFFSKNRDREVTDRGIHLREGKFGQLLNKFAVKEEDFVSKTFDKMFHKLPERIIEFLEPRVKEFEEKLVELLHVELRENVFKEDKFKGTIKAMLSGDMNRDGKNDFMQAIESLFHHKHK